MKRPEKKNPSPSKRSPFNSQISISLPTALLTEVNQLAKKETRTRSGLIALILHQHMRSGLPLIQSQCIRLPYNGYPGPDDAC